MDRGAMVKRDAEVNRVLDYLKSNKIGSEEYKHGLDNLVKLEEIRKTDSEWKTAEQRHLDEYGFKDEQLDFEKEKFKEESRIKSEQLDFEKEKLEVEKQKFKDVQKREGIFKVLDCILNLICLIVPFVFHDKMSKRYMRYDKAGDMPTFSFHRDLVKKIGSMFGGGRKF